MTANAAALRRAIPIPARHLVPVLASGAAIDGTTGLVVLSAGNSYMLHTLGGSAALPALALTLHALVKVGVSPLAGRVADRTRPAVMLPIVPLLASLGLLAMLLTHTLGGYLLGLVALTAGTSTAWVLLRHFLGHATTSAERSRATSWLSIASGGAAAAGFGTGTLVAGIDPRVAFVAAFIVVGMLAFLLNTVSRTTLHEDNVPSPPPRAEVDGRRDRTESATLALVVAGQFALVSGLLVAFWPVVLRDLAVGPMWIAGLLAPAGMLTVALLVVVASRSRPGHRLREIAGLYALATGGLLLAAWSQSAPAFALAMAAVIPALSAATPVVTATVIDYSRDRRGPAGALGWLGAAEAAGSLAGSSVTGIVIAATGAQAALGALALIAALLAGMTEVARRAGAARPLATAGQRPR